MFILLVIILAIIVILFAFYLFKNYQKLIKEIDIGKLDIDIIYSYLSHNKEKNTLFKVISLIGKWTIDIVFIVLFLFFCLSVITKISSNFNVPYQILVVASDSMASKNIENTYLDNINNQFSKYDLILIKMKEEIELYDVICYKADNRLIIHRVIELLEDGYITRGDANNISDSIVLKDDVVGVYTNFKIPYLGYLVFYLQSSYGILAFVVIYIILILYSIYNSKLNKVKKVRFKKVFQEELILKNAEYKIVIKDNSYWLYKNEKLLDVSRFNIGEL